MLSQLWLIRYSIVMVLYVTLLWWCGRLTLYCKLLCTLRQIYNELLQLCSYNSERPHRLVKYVNRGHKLGESPPSNTRFFGPTWVKIPSHTSIGSAVFADSSTCVHHTHTHTHTQTRYVCSSRPHLMLRQAMRPIMSLVRSFLLRLFDVSMSRCYRHIYFISVVDFVHI